MTIVHFILGSIFSVLSATFVLAGMGWGEKLAPVCFSMAAYTGLVSIRYYLKEAAEAINCK